MMVCGERRAGLVDALNALRYEYASDQHAKTEKRCANQRDEIDTLLYGQWHGPLKISAPVFYKDALDYNIQRNS